MQKEPAKIWALKVQSGALLPKADQLIQSDRVVQQPLSMRVAHMPAPNLLQCFLHQRPAVLLKMD